MNWINITSLIITSVAAIATTIAAIASWKSVKISKKMNMELIEEKHLSVQPSFHANKMEHNKSNHMARIIVLNDGSINLRLNNIQIITRDDMKVSASFRYLKKDDVYGQTGKVFSIEFITEEIDNSTVNINIHYTNMYGKKMVAKSPDLDIKNGTLINKEFLYIPFSNTTE